MSPIHQYNSWEKYNLHTGWKRKEIRIRIMVDFWTLTVSRDTLTCSVLKFNFRNREISEMISIDYIMKLIDQNNSIEEQAMGIKLAQDVKCINVFFNSHKVPMGKIVWDNCAKIFIRENK